jgi:hypothetical protein
MPTNTSNHPSHEKLQDLEALLANIDRPGDFFVHGFQEAPMPKITVDTVGSLSFPVPPFQAKQLIEQAELAPHGRGRETILDTSVRKVWQLPPDKVTIAGTSWSKTFATILSSVKTGLGCADIPVSAELYKLLVYDEGAFFLPHRDTEKTPGMFGTLVISLPSFHRGGELIIRHSGHSTSIDLSTTEPSQLMFAAFYADCEHEILPIIEGYRICLVYNLIQGSTTPLLTAPLHDAETALAAELLEGALSSPGAPLKKI